MTITINKSNNNSKAIGKGVCAMMMTLCLGALSFSPLSSTVVRAANAPFDASLMGDYFDTFTNSSFSPNSIVNITGRLPDSVALPVGEVNLSVDGYSFDAGACSFTSNTDFSAGGRNTTFNCPLATGVTTAVKNIYVKLQYEPGIQNSGAKVVVGNPAPKLAADEYDALNAGMSDLGDYLECNQGIQVAAPDSYINCAGTVPSNFVLPQDGLKLTFNTLGSNEARCQYQGPYTLYCPNVFTGGQSGNYDLQAILGGQAPVTLSGQSFSINY
jgi:hypothetical protein